MSAPATSPSNSVAANPRPSTGPRPQVLVVENSPGSGPRRLPEMLDRAGIDTTVVPGGELTPSLDGIDGLVLLGGGFMPDADERAPWLPLERALCRQAVALAIPVLGICLGEQVLAVSSGGQVTEQSGESEHGSCGVELLAAAAADPLFGPLAAVGTLRMIQHHDDSVTELPPGAELLATSDACRVQAFRVGSNAWGVQFHPEAPMSRVAAWDREPLLAAGLDPDAMVAAAEADDEVNVQQAQTLFDAFAAVVTSARQARA